MEKLYLEDSYLKEFDAKVKKVDGKFIILDKTAFYPKGGGQPHDTGKIISKNKEYNVVYVMKTQEGISHEVDKEGLEEGEFIKGKINWERRYKLMRMHTSSHVLASIFHDVAGALITGNQLEENKSRIDFSLENFDKDKILEYIQKANEIIKRDNLVKHYWVSIEEINKNPELVKLARGFGQNMEKIRIVEIEGVDKQADGGCHVNSLKEIGELKFIKADNKGKNNRRVYYGLID